MFDSNDDKVARMWTVAVRCTLILSSIIMLAVFASEAHAVHDKMFVPQPPAQYDRLPLNFIIQKVPIELIRFRCKLETAVGCAVQSKLLISGKPVPCLILVPEEAHHMIDQILRHEFGHCNGWPPNHPD